MDNTELELLLRDAAPQPHLPTGLAAHRERILAGAKARRTRRVRVWTATAAAVAVLLGGGSAAMAGSGMETPWGWVADNVFSVPNAAQQCFAGFTIGVAGEEDSDAAREAREFLSGLDLATLDTAQMEGETRAALLNANDEQGGASPTVVSDAELKQRAVWRVASELVWEHLAAEGYDPNTVGFNMAAEGCDE